MSYETWDEPSEFERWRNTIYGQAYLLGYDLGLKLMHNLSQWQLRELDASLMGMVCELPRAQLRQLNEVILNFKSADELRIWLEQNKKPQPKS